MKDQLYDTKDELQEQRETSKRPIKLNRLVERDKIEGEYSKSQKPANVFSPSQVGYCRRQLYSGKMNIKNMSRYVQGILHAGTVNHFWLEHHLPELVYDRGMETERKFRKRISVNDKDFDLFVSGYADAVDSEGYVYDHKFTGAPSYAQNKPKEKDKRQVMMYLYCLPDVHTGRLEYVQRNGKFEKGEDTMMFHEIKFNPKEFQEILETMEDVAEAVMEREGTELEKVNPFPRCSKDGGDPCFYCQDDWEDTKHEVKQELKEKGVWEQWKEGKAIELQDSEESKTGSETETQESENQ